MRPKIVITEPLPLINEERAILGRHAEVYVCPSPDSEVIMEHVKDADILMVVYAKITADVIDAGGRLRGIIRYGMGVDNIDLVRATERGIPVVNVPDYAVDAVADHTMALILALSRRITRADRVMKEGKWGIWTKPSPDLLGFDLRGKTLGLLGLGKIGRGVAERARGFGMRVIAHDPYLVPEAAGKIGVELVGKDYLFSESDIISLHAPLTDETRGVINEEAISKMRRGVVIINTARGPLIDEEALAKALRDGRVSAAGLDVYAEEPPSQRSPLLGLENVVLTPHIAWYTEEALRRLEMTAVQHALDLLEGRTPSSLVNPEVMKRWPRER